MTTKIVYQNPKYQVLEGENNSVYLRQPKFQYATIIAIHESRLVMVKQYREGVQRDVYELPGGGVEEGEDFETAARRELLEETGLRCGKMTLLGSVDLYACMCNRVAHFYFTDEIVAVEGQDLDSDEDIEILRFTVEEAFANIADGHWRDPETAHGLLLARLKGLI